MTYYIVDVSEDDKRKVEIREVDKSEVDKREIYIREVDKEKLT
jgi:hypothetical protein